MVIYSVYTVIYWNRTLYLFLLRYTKTIVFTGKNLNVLTDIFFFNFGLCLGLTKPFEEFSCDDYPEPTARETGRKCSDKYTEIEIGFEISSGFIKVLSVCFDEDKRDALYSTYNLSKSIGQEQHSVPRPGGFQDGGFYPGLKPHISTLYTKKHELQTLATLLKSNDLASEYLQVNDNWFFMARGHLTAKADFVYGSQQRATFFYVNVAPQWQVNVFIRIWKLSNNFL